MKDKNTIKKELYKQKPIAEFGFLANGFKNYSCILIIEGIECEVKFSIPLSDCAESLTDKIEGHLLIRWLCDTQ